VILSVDGTNVDPRHSLSDLISAKKIGDTVTLSVESSAQGQEQPPRDVKVTLEKNPSGNTPYAGIQYTAAPPRFGRGPRGGAFAGPGVFVADVVADGPASKAGIKARDVITKVQGVAVTDPKEVADAVAAHRPGDTLSVTVRHGGDDKEADVSVTLGANPNDAAKAYMGISMGPFMGQPGPGPRGFGMPRRLSPPGNTPPGI
jgi:S1-C subfamily serine protease